MKIFSSITLQFILVLFNVGFKQNASKRDKENEWKIEENKNQSNFLLVYIYVYIA